MVRRDEKITGKMAVMLGTYVHLAVYFNPWIPSVLFKLTGLPQTSDINVFCYAFLTQRILKSHLLPPITG